MKTFYTKFLFILFLVFCLVPQLYSASDSSKNPYHVNYWVTLPLIGVGAFTNYLGMDHVLSKKAIPLAELESLDKDVINVLDRWAFKQDPSMKKKYDRYSDYTIGASVLLSGLLFFDKNIRNDWFDNLLIYMETMSLTLNIYEWSFLGPTFQNRLRPITYYSELTYDERKSGNNKNSFYSGHVATVAASTFFAAKVYCDYNPQIGNNKYLLYGAATIPPLVLGYFRLKATQHFPSDIMIGLGIGALCGVVIPELHRLKVKDVSVGLYSTSEATGIAFQWKPDLFK